MNTLVLPKTQHLVVFQEVIRSGSISSAAKSLGLTQPAVSKIISDVEAYFGVELIVRKNTGVTLTEAGQVLLSWSESITREMKNMINEMNSMTCNTVVDVSFGFPSLIGFTFMSDMIHKFKEVFPKAQVSMYEAQLSSFLPARPCATGGWTLLSVRSVMKCSYRICMSSRCLNQSLSW